MIRTRTEARIRRHSIVSSLSALVACIALAGGCSRSPRPRADVLPDSAREGKSATGARRAPAPATKPAAAPAGTTTATGTRNGASVGGATTGSSTSSPGVVPQLTAGEQERLDRETKVAMETAQKALDAVDATKLDVERNRKYLIARDFLVQAGEARTRREYERAQGLALKARLLAEEITAH